uniref:Peroxidase n=1 Tax=Tetranychus urticae TaxID=32264 RepID=T1K9D9_TETUR
MQCASPINSTELLVASGSEVFGANLDDAYLAEMEKQYLSSEPFNQLIRTCHNGYDNEYSQSLGSYSKIQEAITAVIPSIYLYIGSDTMVYRTVPGALETSRFVAQLAHESEFFTLITEYLLKTHCATKLDSAMKFPKLKVKGKLTEGQVNKFAVNSCGYRKDQLQFGCNPASKFPAYDGSCNNLNKPSLGMAYSCHRRLIPPDYGDGVKSLRLSVSGQPLPNARLISNEILPSVDEVDPELTQMNMQWGQFMVHDMVRTPITLGNTPECCPPSTLNHPECVTIAPLPKGDSLTSIFNQTCLRNTRTSPCPKCKLGPREQLNAAPHALDLSNIYGYTYQDNLGLRSFRGGKLMTGLDERGGEIMTTAEGNFDPLAIQACNIPPQFPTFLCFKTGDGIRGNQHPALTALQTIMIRRHNQHAEALSVVNPHWTDETLFWEARRLLMAEYNHISFAEYFPTLFDPDILAYFNLNPVKSGYSKYEPETDFSTIQEWATAAGRFGHSQINNIFMVKNGRDSKDSFPFRLKDVFFEMSLIHLGQTDGIIRGLISEPAFEVDPFFVVDVKDFLYQNPNRTTGLDLMVANIMRGRDHGIPGYVNYLDYCFGYKVNDWSDLYEYIPQTQVHNLQRVYKDVRDIDLFWWSFRTKGSW